MPRHKSITEIVRNPNQEDSRKIARLWEMARKVMDQAQHGSSAFEEKQRRINTLLEYLGHSQLASVLVLDAACGCGSLLFVGETDTRTWYFSDGDNVMVKTVVEKCADSFLISRIKQAYWHEIPGVFEAVNFDVVFILWNSLPYIVNWSDDKSEAEITAEGFAALKHSFSAILQACPKGHFVFDLHRNHTQMSGKTEFEGRVLHPFINAVHRDGIRYWVVGTEEEQYLIKGLALDIDTIRGLLLDVGYKKIEQIPEQFELDPFYYSMFAASR